MYKTIPRSSVIGFLIGVLPGAGATIASFLAYGMERNLVNDDEKQKFGKGSVNGLSAPETANNAACSGSFVPMLTLGIPGSGTTAVMLGALLGFGVVPLPGIPNVSIGTNEPEQAALFAVSGADNPFTLPFPNFCFSSSLTKFLSMP
jgi:TctA family transporter